MYIYPNHLLHYLLHHLHLNHQHHFRHPRFLYLPFEERLLSDLFFEQLLPQRLLRPFPLVLLLLSGLPLALFPPCSPRLMQLPEFLPAPDFHRLHPPALLAPPVLSRSALSDYSHTARRPSPDLEAQQLFFVSFSLPFLSFFLLFRMHIFAYNTLLLFYPPPLRPSENPDFQWAIAYFLH